MRTTLAGLAEVDLGPPCTIVIGPVAALELLGGCPVPSPGSRRRGTGACPGRRARLRPRRGRRGGDRAPRHRDRRSDRRWCALRAEAARADSYDWIVLTSANAIDRFLADVRDGRSLGRARLAVVGAATARALSAHHLVADLVPDDETADGLVAAMGPAPSGRATPGHVLFPRAAEDVGTWSGPVCGPRAGT